MTVVTCFNGFLISVIVLQWILFTLMLLRHPDTLKSVFLSENTTQSSPKSRNNYLYLQAIDGDVDCSGAARTTIQQQERSLVDTHVVAAQENDETALLEGVAATVIFRAPKWFHLRYQFMLDNALSNLPNPHHWKIQVFINQDWADSANLLAWHPGLERLLYNDSRVILTQLPNNLTKGKPKQVVESKWFWDNIAAEHVILFSGNGAFCGNTNRHVWEELLELDYCGVPWHELQGIGGDGSSHSIRRRSAMRRIIDMTIENPTIQRKGMESRSIVEAMRHWNRPTIGGSSSSNDPPNKPLFRIASVNQTIAFGGVYNLSNENGLLRLPMVVAGTQMQLQYAERDSLLKHCPELKVIFPSLHEPACFGAHPQPEVCRRSICALQEQIPSHGC